MPIVIAPVISNPIDDTRNQVTLEAAGQLDPVGRLCETDKNIMNDILSRIHIAGEHYRELKHLDFVLVIDLPQGPIMALFESENKQLIFYHRARSDEE
jgi:hypothetical protein